MPTQNPVLAQKATAMRYTGSNAIDYFKIAQDFPPIVSNPLDWIRLAANLLTPIPTNQLERLPILTNAVG